MSICTLNGIYVILAREQELTCHFRREAEKNDTSLVSFLAIFALLLSLSASTWFSVKEERERGERERERERQRGKQEKLWVSERRSPLYSSSLLFSSFSLWLCLCRVQRNRKTLSLLTYFAMISLNRSCYLVICFEKSLINQTHFSFQAFWPYPFHQLAWLASLPRRKSRDFLFSFWSNFYRFLFLALVVIEEHKVYYIITDRMLSSVSHIWVWCNLLFIVQFTELSKFFHFHIQFPFFRSSGF